MNKPNNLKELIEHLQVHPQVWNNNPESPIILTYWRHQDGGIWFKDDQDTAFYLPINCGKTNAETGFAFFVDRFEATKFGTTLKYFYF